MIQTFDTLGQFEKPDISLCNPNRTEIYSLNTARNLKHTMRFNAVSEFTFTIEQYVDGTLIPAYEHVISKKLVLISGVGYFIISEINENTDGKIPSKEVICYSQEIELSFKKIQILNNTIKFTTPRNPETNAITLTELIESYLPSWSFDYIDSELIGLYRTFNIPDNNIYNFLMTDVETAYGCIFTFNTINKTISVYSIPNVTIPTDIYLSHDNLLQNAGLKEIASEMCTKLNVYGSNGLGITSVNPLGGSAIYNFDYYKNTNWMTQSLIDAINDWESLIASNQATYSGYLIDLINLNTILITKNNELDVLELALAEQEVLLRLAIEAGDSLTAIYSAMFTIRSDMATKSAEINVVKNNIIAKTIQITDIVNLLNFDSNFTALEKEELDSFIFENTYQNTSLTVTDTMTPNQRQDVEQQLYDEAVLNVMPKVSVPRYEFSANTTNFIFLPEFLSFTGEVQLGCTVTINVRDTYTITPVLLEMVLTYDNPNDFSLVFSNRLRLDNANFIFTDIVGNNNSVSTTVGFNSEQWGNWETNYKSDVVTFINSALDASVNMLMNSDDEEITISNVGLRGQRLLDPLIPGVYSNKKVWLTSNLLAFTSDNWQTASLALGEVNINGNSSYGLVAETIVGNLIIGDQLLISNSANSFSVDASGATLYNGALSISNTVSEIRIDPNSGIRVQKKTATTGSIGVGTPSTSTGSSVDSLSWSHTTPSQSDRLLVVTISYYKASATPNQITNVKYGSQKLSKAIGNIQGNNASEIWYLKNPVVGVGTVGVYFNENESVIVEAGANVYWNINQTSPIQSTAVANGTSTTPSVVITSSTNNLVIDSLSYNSASTFSVGAGQISLYNVTPLSPQRGASSYESGAASVTMSWTGTSALWVLSAVSLAKTSTVYSLTDTFSLDVNGNAVFAGSLSAATGSFAGSLSAATGSFSGSITASSGEIGGWSITSFGLSNPTASSLISANQDGAGSYDFQLGALRIQRGGIGVDQNLSFIGNSVGLYAAGIGEIGMFGSPAATLYLWGDNIIEIVSQSTINLSSVNTTNISAPIFEIIGTSYVYFQTPQIYLDIPDSPSGLVVRGSNTWNTDITITAGNTLVIRNGLIFDYF